MAKYQITTPDGQKYEITAPDDATQDQVLAYAQKNHAPQATEKKPPSLGGTALRYSAASGLANFADMIPNGLVNAANLGIAGYGALKGALGGKDLPELIPSDALSGWSKIGKATGLINDDYAPTTNGGNIVDFATQAITGGGINPAAITRNASRGMVKPIVRDLSAVLASGVGGGLGNVATKDINTGNTTLDNAIKVGGTLLGGLVPSTIIAARGTAGDRASAAINGVTPENMKIARELKRKAQDAGSPITDYEAIQGATGLNPKMQTQQRLAEQSDAAGKTLTPMMQKRPDANLSMFNKAADSIAPLIEIPDTLAGQLQKAAKDSITTARQYGNELARPHYESAAPKVLSPAQESATVFDPALKMAIDHVTKDPLSGVYGAPKNTVGAIDAAKKYLDDIKNKAVISGENNRAANAGSASKAAIEVGDAVAPEYATARGIVAKNMQDSVIPLEVGQVGKLARSDDFKQQSETLLPKDPADVTPGVIEDTISTISAQHPDIVNWFLSHDLRRKYDAATRDTLSGEMPTAGAGFAKNVAGTTNQEQNLIAALKASGVNPEQFQDTLSIFRAQGMRPPVNSATAANATEAQKLGGMLGALSRPLTAIPQAIDSWRNGMAAGDLAKVLASDYKPGSLAVEELARSNGTYSPMKQQMLINLLMSNQYMQPDQ